MAGARLAPLTHEDREQLKRALLETDDETRRCVGPLLALEPVQYALLSFVKDPSRSFEDHVWDPVTQTVLNRLRSTGVDPSDSQVETNSVFETELMQCARGGGAVVEITDTDKEAELLAEVDNTQADGKTKFKRGDHYAAMNAFKKSVSALLAYHEDQNYGKVYDPQEWDEEELRQRYVTLCCNVAVCAIKLRDCAMIRLYATKALRVDEHSSKAIYALAKVNLLEHRFEDSRAEAQKGLGLYPGNDQFAKLLRDIEAVELRQVEDRVNLLAVKELTEKVEDEAQKRRDQQESAHRAKLERAAEVTPLPTLQFDDAPFQHLNTYFMRIKQFLQVAIDPVFNPDNGESSLFECTIVNGSTKVVLAAGVRAGSKKLAKHTAAKAAILKLWEMKRDAGKLLPEDQEHWDEYEVALRDGTIPPPNSPPTGINDENAVVAPQSKHADNQVIQLTLFERDGEPVAVLNMLNSQRRLRVEFTMDDVAPSKFDPLFKCTCVLNGQELGVATAPAKKKAKAEAARLAMNAAVANGIIQYVRTVTVEVPSVPMSENGAVAEGLDVA